MDPSSQARALALARIGLGAVFTLAPRLVLPLWVGRADARRPVVRMLSRSVGARDLALGLGTLLALQHEGPVRGWVEAGMVSDAGDALAIALARSDLPRFGALAGFGSAAGAAVLGRRIVSALAAGATAREDPAAEDALA